MFAMSSSLRVDREPDQTILNQCIDYLSNADTHRPSSGSSATMKKLPAPATLTPSSNHEAVLRFECMRIRILDQQLNSGLLRPGATEIVFLHGGGRCLCTRGMAFFAQRSGSNWGSGAGLS